MKTLARFFAPGRGREVPPGDLSAVLARLERLESAVRDLREAHPLERPVAELQASDRELVSKVAELMVAVSEGIQHVDRSERRVRAVVQSAKRRMEAAGYIDEGVEAESADLFADDGESGGGRRLHAVPDHVEAPRPRITGLPGTWSEEHLRALTGG